MSPVTLRAPALPPDLNAAPSPSVRGAKAAREFEAQLIGNLLDSLEKTFAGLPEQGSLAGSDDYSYLGTRALAGALADRGGFGIAAMISQYLVAHEGK
jgi:hypothetical protein